MFEVRNCQTIGCEDIVQSEYDEFCDNCIKELAEEIAKNNEIEYYELVRTCDNEDCENIVRLMTTVLCRECRENLPSILKPKKKKKKKTIKSSKVEEKEVVEANDYVQIETPSQIIIASIICTVIISFGAQRIYIFFVAGSTVGYPFFFLAALISVVIILKLVKILYPGYIEQGAKKKS